MRPASSDPPHQGTFDLDARNAAIAFVAAHLPGLTPHDNRRSLCVTAPYDRLSLGEFLRRRHPHKPMSMWEEAMARGDLWLDGRPAQPAMVVRKGAQVVQLERDVVEPMVDGAMRVVHEDSDLFVVNKPAPLPVHPSGRYNRHTVVALLRAAFADLTLRPVHRLDAATTGVLILTKNRAAARHLSQQLEQRRVHKLYLARVVGHPDWTTKECDAAISVYKVPSGGRELDAGGVVARSQFRRLHNDPDGTSLVMASPESGRTNQLRLHLAALGHPILGDAAYANGSPTTVGAPMVDGQRVHLHAWRVSFDHPNGSGPVTLEAPAPWVDNIEQYLTGSDRVL